MGFKLDTRWCTCIEKLRNKHNKIIGYVLQDRLGAIRAYRNDLECRKAGINVDPPFASYADIDALKKQMASGEIVVDNLALTTDNRIIDSNKEFGTNKNSRPVHRRPGDLEVKAELIFTDSGSIEKANDKFIPAGVVVGYIIANCTKSNIWFTRRSSNGLVKGYIKAGKAVAMRKDDAITLMSESELMAANGVFSPSKDFKYSWKSTIEKYLITINDLQKFLWEHRFRRNKDVSKLPKVQIGEQSADGSWQVKNEYKELFYDLIDPKKRNKTAK